MVEALVASPILTLFVVIGLGYLLGEISLWGFRLGVAGVLFVGLGAGSLHRGIALPEFVASLGLIIFVYTIGIQSGADFFASFQRQGYRYSLLAAGAVAFGALLAAGLGWALRLDAARTAGLFCGALTNTPALAAAQERLRQMGSGLAEAPTEAYSIAYPLGVVGVLLVFQAARRRWSGEIQPQEEAEEIQVRNFAVTNPGVAGQPLGEVLRLHRDPGFVVSRVQHNGQLELARPDTVLERGDVVAVVGGDEALELAQQIFGEPAALRLERDRTRLDYRRVFVSSAAVVGRRVSELELEAGHSYTITRLRRGDADIVPQPDTRLEYGDRVRVLTAPANFGPVARLFGDSIRGTAETDFVSVAIGMVLGVLIGMLPLPLPGGGTLKLGLAGGPLLAALLLGKLERTGRISWVLPLSANLTLRHVGLVLFLAAVGTRAGYGFAATVRENGLPLLAGGALITLAVAAAAMAAGHFWLRIPLDELMGVAAGVQTQPACLAHAANAARTERPNVGYASVYPAAMIAKIVLAQLLATFAGRG